MIGAELSCNRWVCFLREKQCSPGEQGEPTEPDPRSLLHEAFEFLRKALQERSRGHVPGEDVCEAELDLVQAHALHESGQLLAFALRAAELLVPGVVAQLTGVDRRDFAAQELQWEDARLVPDIPGVQERREAKGRGANGMGVKDKQPRERKDSFPPSCTGRWAEEGRRRKSDTPEHDRRLHGENGSHSGKSGAGEGRPTMEGGGASGGARRSRGCRSCVLQRKAGAVAEGLDGDALLEAEAGRGDLKNAQGG